MGGNGGLLTADSSYYNYVLVLFSHFSVFNKYFLLMDMKLRD